MTGWFIRLPVLHDADRMVSKQTTGLRDVRTLNKCSAVAETSDRLATIDMDRGLYGRK